MSWFKHKRILKISLIFGAVCLLLIIWAIVGAFFIRSASLATKNVKINDQMIKVELAIKPADQYLGLSYRPSLCADCGLLFLFSDSRRREFVMRGMNFPLDIIFINEHKIISIAANLPPEGNTPTKLYWSSGPADAVLEVNGGRAALGGVKVGDYVDY